jgi:hypothetical protein
VSAAVLARGGRRVRLRRRGNGDARHRQTASVESPRPPTRASIPLIHRTPRAHPRRPTRRPRRAIRRTPRSRRRPTGDDHRCDCNDGGADHDGCAGHGRARSTVRRALSASRPVTGARRDASAEPFGPLGTEPSTEIRLPAARSPETPTQESPWTFAEPIDGGLLVTVRSSSFGFFSESLLAAVALRRRGPVGPVRARGDRSARQARAAPTSRSSARRTSEARGPGSRCDWTPVRSRPLPSSRRHVEPLPDRGVGHVPRLRRCGGNGHDRSGCRPPPLVDLTTGSETEIEFPASAAASRWWRSRSSRPTRATSSSRTTPPAPRPSSRSCTTALDNRRGRDRRDRRDASAVRRARLRAGARAHRVRRERHIVWSAPDITASRVRGSRPRFR